MAVDRVERDLELGLGRGGRQRMILELEGIEVCPTSATTIAAMKVMLESGELHADDVVLANLTGGIRSTAVTPKEYTTLTKAEILSAAA